MTESVNPLRSNQGNLMTFEKGNTLSRGRPRGAKNRLTARVLEDMHQVWTELVSEGRTAPTESKTTGLSALRIMARERPAEFAKLYATTLMPKELDIADTTLADMSYEEIEAKLAERTAALEVLRQEPISEKALN
jgi:hypothetical protein